jgi:hypothetical protein
MASRGKSAGPEPDTPEIDDLFKLPLAEFTAARNALAARLKKAGRAAQAERVKAIPKPSVAAWVVNQLSRTHSRELRELLVAGDRFRDAQAKQLAGKAGDLRGTLEARRAALADLTKLATSTLEGSAHAVTPDLLRRVTTTLEALSAYGSHGGPEAGRLTDDLSPPGFETLAALVPRGGGDGANGPSKVLRFAEPAVRKTSATARSAETKAEDERTRKAEAKAALERARVTLREVRTQAERAERQMRAAAADSQAAEQAKQDAAARLEEATSAATAARQRARQMASEAEQAAQRVEDAEREVDRAQRVLDGR